MPQTLLLNYHLKEDLRKVYPAILDMRRFGRHHPFMKEVSLLKATPEFSEYIIKEFVWILGFIPQWPRYTAKVFEKEKNRHILYTSQVKSDISLCIDFHFSAAGNQTKISEAVSVAGNSFTSRILLSTIQKSHGLLFKNLETELAG